MNHAIPCDQSKFRNCPHLHDSSTAHPKKVCRCSDSPPAIDNRILLANNTRSAPSQTLIPRTVHLLSCLLQNCWLSMDPTLAPGYVPPNGGKDKPSKVHHWVEVQKERTKTSSDLDDGNLGDNSDNSSVSSPSTPVTQPTQPVRQQSYLGAKSNSGPPLKKPHHPRMASWRGGRSNLSD